MPRTPRHRMSGSAQHVIQRGNNRIDIFRSAGDFTFFLAALHQACSRYLLDIHAYTLMTNHYHLLVTPRRATSISDTMQAVGPRYVRYFNRKYGRTGTLYEGRYRSCRVDSEAYWYACMRYVELNPLRAGLVRQLESYRWTSYAANALGRSDPLIVHHPLYLSLGQSPQSRQQNWRAICREALTTEQLDEIRYAVHRGRALGEPSGEFDALLQ